MNVITKENIKEREILNLIVNNSFLSSDKIAKIVGLSAIGARYHLKNLKKKGIIIRKGHGKGGSWEFVIINYHFFLSL